MRKAKYSKIVKVKEKKSCDNARIYSGEKKSKHAKNDIDSTVNVGRKLIKALVHKLKIIWNF